MAGWNHDNANWTARFCVVCGESFTPKSGAHKFCGSACKGKWQYLTGKYSTENQYKTISGDWKRYFQRLCAQKKRESISYEDCLNILGKQEGKCALSGVELTCKLELGVACKTNASLDRIIPGGPYIKENIQLVCRALNSWRGDTDKDEFIWWCSKVSDYNRR